MHNRTLKQLDNFFFNWKLADTLRGSWTWVQSASLIMTSSMTS